MKIAIAGCIHGDFEALYEEIQRSEQNNVDLVLCCGDLEVKEIVQEKSSCSKQSTKWKLFSKIPKDLILFAILFYSRLRETWTI